jgi:hypothetical protein
MNIRILTLSSILLFSLQGFSHARLVDPVPRTNSDLGLKGGPCGTLNGVQNAKGNNPTPLVAGSTITVKYIETIEHPAKYYFSWSTTAVDNATEFQANMKLDPTVDLAGPAPHNYTTTLQVPNTPCDNCTLQFTQLMLESNTYYYSCADVKIVANGTTPPPPPPPPGDGGNSSQSSTSPAQQPGFGGCGMIAGHNSGSGPKGPTGALIATLFLMPLLLLVSARRRAQRIN